MMIAATRVTHLKQHYESVLRQSNANLVPKAAIDVRAENLQGLTKRHL
jgi:hypothetical protein